MAHANVIPSGNDLHFYTFSEIFALRRLARRDLPLFSVQSQDCGKPRRRRNEESMPSADYVAEPFRSHRYAKEVSVRRKPIGRKRERPSVDERTMQSSANFLVKSRASPLLRPKRAIGLLAVYCQTESSHPKVVSYSPGGTLALAVNCTGLVVAYGWKLCPYCKALRRNTGMRGICGCTVWDIGVDEEVRFSPAPPALLVQEQLQSLV